jgi:hypothetical protein
MEAAELQLLAVLSIPHLLYAFIWFKPATFRALCGKKSDAVLIFSRIAAALKGAQRAMRKRAAFRRNKQQELTSVAPSHNSGAVHGGVPVGDALRAAQPAGRAARAVGAGHRALRRRPGEPAAPNCHCEAAARASR